jgi:sigma-B regulation protein RsbU (phosphoserine phosphatase)
MANAGHNPSILLEADGTARVMAFDHGMALGVQPNVPYKDTELILRPGQSLFLYTDGVTEALSATNEIFGVARLINHLEQAPKSDPAVLLRRTLDLVANFQGGRLVDDVTMLALRRADG